MTSTFDHMTGATAGDDKDNGKIVTRAEAENECSELKFTMDSLLSAIEEETALVRAGKLREAGDLQPRKAELMQQYIRRLNRTRDNSVALGNLAPVAVADLRRGHVEFQAVLKINLAVLATAREVAEKLVRSVAESVGVAESPKTYTRGGTPPQTTSTRGIAINRSL
ncbi:flagellar protein FlgN [Breoghania sp.]|uniref:flagellar protein FlgN n=1 Tax=Breoghania sp. TaxID=2065378 RepID=UPI002AA79CFC|nr:flagellar protein FlgN [Breoghania sp.]